LMREGDPIGVIILLRRAVRPFTKQQIELVETFADQAMIAIENARLFAEVQTRTRDLTEALEQQTATSEVLGVISSTPSELETVFKTILDTATRICGANFATLRLREGDNFRIAALHNMPTTYAESREREPLYQPPPGSGFARALATKQIVHIADLTAEPNYPV